MSTQMLQHAIRQKEPLQKKHRKSRQDMTLFLQAVPSYISEVSWTLFSKIHFYLQIVLKTIKKKSHTFSEAHAIL